MKKDKVKILAADIAECALFVTLMCVFTLFVKIPFWPVPLTFQTVISVTAGLTLGWKKGAISMAVYCFMGLVGIPVFTGFSGSILYVLQPTFGYIIGFIFSAAVAGLIAGKSSLPLWRYILAAVAAFLVNYLIGIPYFAFIWQFHLQNDDLAHYVLVWNVLYMPKDLVLCILSGVLAKIILPAINKGRSKLKRSEPEKNDI